MDEYHSANVDHYIKTFSPPSQPQTIPTLYCQLLRSAFSYSVLRKYLKSHNGGQTPQIKDFPKILNGVFNTNTFTANHFNNLDLLEKEVILVANKRGYPQGDAKKILDYYDSLPKKGGRCEAENKIIAILLSTKRALLERTGGSDAGLVQFYSTIDKAIQSGPEAMLEFAHNLTKKPKIYWMADKLACDFLKNLGFTRYVKIDIHLSRIIKMLTNETEAKKCEQIMNDVPKSLHDKLLFAVAIDIADFIGLEPFRLDKILYLKGTTERH
jgi:hypothetical protein